MFNLKKIIRWYKIRKLEKRIVKINKKIFLLHKEKVEKLHKINYLVSS